MNVLLDQRRAVVYIPFIMYRMAAILVALTLACAPTGGGGNDNGNSNDNSDDDGAASLTGALVYFSGRPPPEWDIPESLHADVAERVSGLTAIAASDGFPRFGPVAYRVMNNEGVEGIPDAILVQDGVVEVRMGETYTYFSDDKQLEAALRASAQSDGVYAELGIVEEANSPRR